MDFGMMVGIIRSFLVFTADRGGYRVFYWIFDKKT